MNELTITARHEQINVLQPLIYNDEKLKTTMDLNHKFSRMTSGWISPQFKVVYSFSPTTDDPELQTVFDAPKSPTDRLLGTIKSLPNQQDRMEFVAHIAEQFNRLMLKRRPYMEKELQKIRGWIQS